MFLNQLSTMFKESPFRAFIRNFITAGTRVLDLGSGNCSFASELAKKGAKLYCYDKEVPPHVPPNVVFQQAAVEQWFAIKGEYDAVLLLNVIQWLPKPLALKRLLPFCLAKLTKGGILYLETLTRPPQPPFRITPPSFYRLGDFGHLPRPAYSAKISYRGKGIHPEVHTWHSLQMIWVNERRSKSVSNF